MFKYLLCLSLLLPVPALAAGSPNVPASPESPCGLSEDDLCDLRRRLDEHDERIRRRRERNKRLWRQKQQEKKKAEESPCAQCPPGEKGEKGDKGDPGPQGKIGPRGRTILLREVKYVYSGLNIGIGYMGSLFFPKNDYAWAHGPSLRLTSKLAVDKELLLEVGWGWGRDEAVMGQVQLRHWWDDGKSKLGCSGAIYGQAIGLDPDKASGGYVALVPGLVGRTTLGDWRFDAGLGLALGWADYRGQDGDPIVGLVSSVGVSYDF